MSSAKLSSLPAELKALAGFCSPVIEVSRVFVGSLQKDSFHDKLTKEVFRRAKSYMDKQGEPPRLELLQEDIGLSQSARDLLASAPRAPKTVEQAQGLAAQVKQYADTRRLYHTTRAVLESLEEGAVPIDELVDFVSQEITKLQVVDGATVDVVHYGKEGNADELVADILYGEDNDEIIPTGLESFDSVNGGFFRGSLVVCGANSGGGKCGCPSTEVALSTLVIDLEDGTSLELEPEHPVTVLRNGELLETVAGRLEHTDDLVRF